ncbi:Exopolyphosphatase [Scheffersomyces spartinae]|uniref:Exopolyphosphatase n=1 Tax=Scheffersomyces spartinae TaxID=45513 RepID=A0A9P7V7K1_9ASCO|nr:Exopolyphosphatase [Scheffersomyces spartinae]KAG7192830.1 Exopolyphosphatase [Scheffersomyces spartinae]
MTAVRTIKSFLVELKSVLQSEGHSFPLRFVTGNQSCDMDSTVCALTYSYMNYLHSGKWMIPLLNIPRAELRLRKDISKLLQAHKITNDLLYFVEDLDRLVTLSSPMSSTYELVLVDHCNVQGDQWEQYLKDGKATITAIVDHHEDEGIATEANPRIIKSTGSCSSLVFNYWYNQFQDKGIFQDQTELVELLLAPLLLDTSNMSQKVEEPDVIALGVYRQILEKDPSALQITSLFSDMHHSSFNDSFLKQYTKKLKSYKKNLDGFTFYDILRKDYKSFTFVSNLKPIKVGFSSLSSDFEYCCTVHKDDFVSGASQLLSASGLDLLVMTASFTDKQTRKYSRQFSLFYAKDSGNLALFESIPKLVNQSLDLNNDVPNIELYTDFIDSIGETTNYTFTLFNQGNTAASRKQVVPAVKKAIEQ